VTHDGTVLLNERIVRSLELTPEQIARENRQVQTELDRRNKLFRGDSPDPDLKGREVIIADDGLASGYTMLASIHMVHKAEAGRIIVAVPTAHPGSIDMIRPKVDEVYCANIREGRYFAVAEAYRNWYNLSDDEVFGLLEKSSH
jgi:putative phosphoribosyl transferase